MRKVLCRRLPNVVLRQVQSSIVEKPGLAPLLCSGLAQIGAGDLADHPDSRLDQVVLDK